MRPIASTTRSDASSSPELVRTPVTCGRPPFMRVVRPATSTPRRTRTRGSFAATEAKTCSVVVRLAVTETKRSSPSRAARSATAGGSRAIGSTTAAPAASSASRTSGSSRSSTRRTRGCRKCGWRNCTTPERAQPVQAASTASGAGVGSRSSTATSCPSRASSIAVASPQTPPPRTVISATALGRDSLASETGRPHAAAVCGCGRTERRSSATPSQPTGTSPQQLISRNRSTPATTPAEA